MNAGGWGRGTERGGGEVVGRFERWKKMKMRGGREGGRACKRRVKGARVSHNKGRKDESE
jgi:hypothetical protein